MALKLCKAASHFGWLKRKDSVMEKRRQINREKQKLQVTPANCLKVLPSAFKEVTAQALKGAADVFRKKGHLDPAFYFLDGKGEIVAIAAPPMNDPMEKTMAAAGLKAVAAGQDAKAILA